MRLRLPKLGARAKRSRHTYRGIQRPTGSFWLQATASLADIPLVRSACGSPWINRARALSGYPRVRYSPTVSLRFCRCLADSLGGIFSRPWLAHLSRLLPRHPGERAVEQVQRAAVVQTCGMRWKDLFL